jgi:putative PIN family toxin of toxin-antitoxin system
MSRVVLDTNVVFAAFATRGLCESIFELCLEQHTIISSDFLYQELEDKLSSKLKLPENTVADILALYQSRSQLVIPAKLDKETCRDIDDIPVLGTCVSGEATYLVTGDKDRLVLNNLSETKIITPRAFYEAMK